MYAQIRDTEVFYETIGEGPPIVVLHGGLGLDHGYLRPWLDRLSDRAELVYYDQRGNGRSPRPASFEGIGHDTWVNDVDALRARLGHEQIVLLAHSYGAFIAQEYALAHGDRLRGLILCSTVPVIDHKDVMMANARARATPEQLETLIKAFSEPFATDDAFARTWERILPVYFHQYDPEIGRAIVEVTRFCAAAYNQCTERCLPHFDVLARLPEIRTPTLLLAGRHDWITPPREGAERMHAALPNSQLFVFERSGHFPFIEENSLFIKTVSCWVRGLDAPPGGHRA